MHSIVLNDLTPLATGPGPRWANQSPYPEFFLTETKKKRKSLSSLEAVKCKTQELSAAMCPAMRNQLVCSEKNEADMQKAAENHV